MLAIRLPEDIEKRLESISKKTGRTKTFYVRQAILAHLEDLEDYFLAEKETEAIRTGKSSTRPLTEVAEEYGVDY